MTLEAEWKPFSLTYVEYPVGDGLGALFAATSLCPIILSIMHATWFLQARDLHTLCFGVGVILNYILNLFLKITIQELRPQPTWRNPSHHWQQYGMPSTHAQFMAFYSCYLFLFVALRLPYEGRTRERVWKGLFLVMNFASAFLVMYGRIYLAYHTVEQVFYGCLIGMLLSYAWFCLVDHIFTPWFPWLASTQICELFLIRDLTYIPNVIWFEYWQAKNEGIKRMKSSLKRKKAKRI
ncbi:dolichyldiphosphatase 1-like [Tigriopus californicus]|nr:dolichyldiphosphatase 1-like [Tigriopus californicus]|eukprot:TCALIF_11440-PA protein Name:"Similar to Dolpp1 Dolichyldiphosphatase 1 (Mus musculus)" AED:0.40 eAED:0.41 QI:0/-1/0/1/-1/1/1/0/236